MKPLFLLVALSLACTAVSAKESNAGYGGQTRHWMAKQKSSADKAPPRGLPGEAADRVYQRYLQSFTRPIPEKFERDKVGTEGQR